MELIAGHNGASLNHSERRTIGAKRTSCGDTGQYKRAVPTLLEVEGFRFYFFSLEGSEPPHVHVRKGGGKAKFWLSPVELVYFAISRRQN